MVKEQFKLNKKGEVAWLTEEALWLVSPRAVGAQRRTQGDDVADPAGGRSPVG